METEKFKGVEKLEIGKDYISEGGDIITIDRKGNNNNNGFMYGNFVGYISCEYPDFWREATPEEVKEQFEAHLVIRYGKDWETMKIKKRHPNSSLDINEGLWSVCISKDSIGGWNVWNKNGMLYYKGIWVKALEPEVNSLGVNLKAWDELVKDAPQSTFGQKSALKEQIGGKHYSEMVIQPIEFIHRNNLSFIQGNVIECVCQYKTKSGVEDLLKAKHYIDLLIELESEKERE